MDTVDREITTCRTISKLIKKKKLTKKQLEKVLFDNKEYKPKVMDYTDTWNAKQHKLHCELEELEDGKVMYTAVFETTGHRAERIFKSYKEIYDELIK